MLTAQATSGGRAALADSGLAVFVDWARERNAIAILEQKPAALAGDYAVLRTMAHENML